VLTIRAFAAFLALPAMIAGLIPWLWLLPADRWRLRGTQLGWPVLAAGLFVLLWCVRDFYVIGRGTLAPWDPPRRLVVVGLYRYARNPMYVGVVAVIAGWSLVAGSLVLGGYAVFLLFVFHLRVVLYEEPVLARLFGKDWEQYRAKVNRWWPGLP